MEIIQGNLEGLYGDFLLRADSNGSSSKESWGVDVPCFKESITLNCADGFLMARLSTGLTQLHFVICQGSHVSCFM